MSEFSEVMREAQRMCDYRRKHGLKCNDCDAVHICGLEIMHVGLDTLCADADAVMIWAAEHPAPVYPTWLEYLARYCGAPGKIDFGSIQFAEEVHGVLPETYIHWLMTHRIPADIAEKLGIEPKEGT